MLPLTRESSRSGETMDAVGNNPEPSMPLPPLEDLAFWLPILESGSWCDPRGADDVMGATDLMSVFIARRSDCSRRVEEAIARRIIDIAKVFIRQNVSRRHHQNGYDIVDDALSQLLRAMATPEGASAKGLATNFKVRTRFIIVDCIRRSRGWATRRSDVDDAVEAKLAAPFSDPTDAIEREQALLAVDDARDRQMLRDHQDGFTWTEIGQRNGCDQTTARRRVMAVIAAAEARTKLERRARP